MRNRIVHLVAAAIVLGWGALLAAAVGSTASRERAPVTIVILPPDVKAEDAETRVAAELLCDRLAERLGDIAGIRVVDRTQIDRVLAEHALARKPAGPVLAYDAMVRVSVDALVPLPRVRLSVIDLSHGNVIGFTEQHWHMEMSPEALSEMVEACAVAAKAAAEGPGDGVKVRVVNPTAVYTDTRLGPLADRLRLAFEESVQRSPGTRLIHHLEAVTAKEEALLLLVGLTRLAGGRAFAPQADATVEFRLTEVDSLGKDFEETTVRVEFRVEKGAPTGWSVVTGKVGDWDRVIAEAWRTVAAELAGAAPDAAEGFLNEMAVRRRQADAELQKLRSLDVFRYPGFYDFSKESGTAKRLELIAQTAATAAKLDPTSEEAAFLDIKFNYVLRRAEAEQDKVRAREILLPTIRDALRYFRTFGAKASRAGEVSTVAREATYRALSPYYSPETPGVYVLDAVAELTDLAVDAPLHMLMKGWESGSTVNLIYERMLEADVPPVVCHRWRDKVLKQIDTGLVAARGRVGRGNRSFENAFTSLRAFRIKAALESGDSEAARALLEDMLETVPGPRAIYNQSRQELLDSASRLGGADLVSKVSRWLRYASGLDRSRVSPMPVHWPAADFPRDPEPTVVKGVAIRITLEGYHKPSRLWPIGISENRLYLVVYRQAFPMLWPEAHERYRQRARLGYMPVDSGGRPLSREIVLVPDPPISVESRIMAGKVFAGRVCLATTHMGLLVYDPRRNGWTRFGVEQGLPDRYVGEVHGLEGSMLLCGAGYPGASAIFTLDLGSGQVVLRQRQPPPAEPIFAVWRAGDRWLGLLRTGLIEDVLAPKPVRRPWHRLTSLGWDRCEVLRAFGRNATLPPPLGMVQVRGRRFIAFPDVLREVDEQGRMVREWGITHRADLEKTNYVTGELLCYYRVTVPGELPGHLLAGGDGLVLYFLGPRGIVCFDPDTDQWYGPVEVDGVPPMPHIPGFVVSGGIFYGNVCVVYVTRDAILAAAEGAGLVASSEQLKQRLDKRIQSASTFDRAKFAFSLRQFDEAKALLEQVLAEEPSSGKALIVMGLLHERHALNNPEKALRYYKTAAEVADTPSGLLGGMYLQFDVLAGMYLQFEWYLRAERPAEALAIGREMLARFNLEAGSHRRVQAAVNRLAAQVEGESE